MSYGANVDPHEIGKFEELASRWWDPDSEFKPLHQLNPLRLEYIENQSGGLAAKRALDVGCGGGLLSEGLALYGADVKGIDMSEAPLEIARLHLLESGLEVDYERVPVERLAHETPARYDLVACMEMLEHVPDPASIVLACAELVKPGGMVFFSTINRSLKSYLLAIIGAEYLLRMLPRGTHDYAKFIRPSELAKWLRDADLTLRDQIGVTYNPFTGAFKLDPRDVDVNYMICARRPT
jgi:2-polyprenyl-6-hydroxyphenyl methylase/3-demethylubiquinone-9 3-methyltransferase